jgi:6-phosphogluconolactonase (cycloisomerase 2 family)
MIRFGWSGLVAAMLSCVGPPDAFGQQRGDGRLELVDGIQGGDLQAVVSVAFSPDGRYLYTASWQAATVAVFKLDPDTGRLEPSQTLNDPETLAGTTSLALSPDGRYAIASAFQSRTAVLFRRDLETGELSVAETAHDGADDVRMQFPIDASFSPDGKHAYIIDDHGPAEGGQGSIVAFRVEDGKLKLAGIDEGVNGCYRGARGISFHPDGRTAFIASNDANALVVADRDPETGRTRPRQIWTDSDEAGQPHGLAGAMTPAVSPDGRFVYVCSGRFRGDDAVVVFRMGSNGHLVFVQEFLNGGEGGLEDFLGGNQIAISPDGRNVYAAATRSGTVAAFRRDPDTGQLTYLQTLPDGGEGGELGAAGIGVSPNGRFVYVATEDKLAISVFRRDP